MYVFQSSHLNYLDDKKSNPNNQKQHKFFHVYIFLDRYLEGSSDS